MITKQVSVEASHMYDTLNVSIDMSQEDWDALSTEEQDALLQNEVNENPNQPYWVLAD
jgi:hypothetical protein